MTPATVAAEAVLAWAATPGCPRTRAYGGTGIFALLGKASTPPQRAGLAALRYGVGELPASSA